MPNSLPVDSLMQTSQHVTAGIHFSYCTLRHEFNVDDSCIPEYRCPKFSSGVTHFFFLSEELGISTAFELVLFED